MKQLVNQTVTAMDYFCIEIITRLILVRFALFVVLTFTN